MSSGLRSDTARRVRARAVRTLRKSPVAGALSKVTDAVTPAPTLESRTLSDLIKDNASFVLDTLAGAGVPHRLAGTTPRDRFVVAVPPAQLDAAVTALTSAVAGTPFGLLSADVDVKAAADLPALLPDGRHADVAVWSSPGTLLTRPSQQLRAACIVRFDDEPDLSPSLVDVISVAPETVEPAPATVPATLPFPVDIVYTWVDDADPAWLERKHHALEDVVGHELNFAATAAGRFKNRDELKYSLRSIWQFAPWVNHIYIVTDDQHPSWLDPNHPKVTVVSHREIFNPDDALPVFNSHAIESQLHHIDGLSEHYLYMNDDFLFGRPIRPHLFFHSNGVAKFFKSYAQIPLGEPTVDDAPVDAAAKNVRTLLRDTFGRTVSQKFKHTPQAQQRSVLYEMEERYRDHFHRTARSRFRNPTDLSIPSSMQHHYAYLSGRAVEGSITYRYIGLGDHDRSLQVMARVLAERKADCYCINDADVPDADVDWADETVADFFSRYYPFSSEYEIS